MTQLVHQKLEILRVGNKNIERVRDLSDGMIKRVRVIFKNSYELSVICGFGTYGGESGLFEIAIFDKDGNYCPQLFDAPSGDDVLGWQTAEDVMRYVEKIGNL